MDVHALSLPRPSPDTWRKIVSTLCHVENPVLDDFSAFVEFYGRATCRAPAGHAARFWPSPDEPGLRSHEAFLAAAAGLTTPSATKATLAHRLFEPAASDEERARCLRILVSCTFMVDCASRDDFAAAFLLRSEGGFPNRWEDNQSIEEWFGSTFPTSPSESLRLSELRRPIRAWELEKRLHIRIIPTDDLAQHLFYNRDAKTLSIFHQVAYLRALVRSTATKRLDLSTPPSKGFQHGLLPPRLLLETLFSIYYVLFPVNDRRSFDFVGKLVAVPGSSGSFDPTFGRYDLAGATGRLPNDFQFSYWAQRLRTLENIAEHPPPTTWLIQWVEDHTSERNALSVAIIGVFMAAFFGLLAVILGAVQVWISYRAWQDQLGVV